MDTAARPPFHADHVGSLLRPAALHEARARASRGEIGREALRAVEDRCIRDAVSLQEEVGLQTITDGEFRRDWWHIDFLRGFEGVSISNESFGAGFQGADVQPPMMRVSGRVRCSRHPMLDHFTYLRSHTKRTAKFCMPSPAMLHGRSERAALLSTYPDIDEFWSDLGAAYREVVRSLCQAGCSYLQIDDTTIATLCDPRVREQYRKLGDDPDRLPVIYAEAVNSAIRDVPPDVAVTVHTCRGNFKSTWMATGGYEPVAEMVFSRLHVDGFFLEYDTERAGGFEPLRFMPPGKKVVLGLVSSKLPALENKEDLKRRIDAASRYVPVQDLCLSPQCGFASTHHGNRLTIDDQRRKLSLVLEVAQEIWG